MLLTVVDFLLYFTRDKQLFVTFEGTVQVAAFLQYLQYKIWVVVFSPPHERVCYLYDTCILRTTSTFTTTIMYGGVTPPEPEMLGPPSPRSRWGGGGYILHCTTTVEFSRARARAPAAS